MLSFLQTEHPIIQAPMAGSQDYKLAVAVSNAGGLGSLPCAMLSAEGLQQQLTALTQATDKPYNLNFFCHQTPTPDSAVDEQWRNTLQPYYREWDIDPDNSPAGPSRAPFSQAVADIIAPFKPPVVSFHFGLPSEALLAQVKSWGTMVLSSATTVEEALWLEAHGADAVIAQGLEAGGHRGMFLSEDLNSQMGTMALLPQIVAAVKIPVIAAGGIADKHSVAAALQLGASAVQLGTSFLLCDEATTSQVHRQALKNDNTAHNATHTACTNIFSGRPARGIINRAMRELGPMSPQAPAFPLATAAIAPLRSAAEKTGSGDFSPLWSGQNNSGCREIPAAELLTSLIP
jgi:nitronate monooxygenase